MDAPTRIHENPGDLHGFCAMERDTADADCRCPDLAVTVRTVLRTGASVMRFSCQCCKLPIDRQSFGRSTA